MNALFAQIQSQIDAKDAQIATEQASIAALNMQIAQLLNPWIRCSDRLPEEEVQVLSYFADKGVFSTASYHPRCTCSYLWHSAVRSRATHWMPLPSPPTD